MNLDIFSKENSLNVTTLQSLRNIILVYVLTGTTFTPYICVSCDFIDLLRQSLSLPEKLYDKTVQHKVSLVYWLTPHRDKELKLNCTDYNMP